jgi:hypothetical protein
MAVVTTSAEHVKTVWPGGSWPDGLTLKQNLIDLGWHEKEFQLRPPSRAAMWLGTHGRPSQPSCCST